MTENPQRRTTRRRQLFSIAASVFVVCSVTFEIIVHRDRFVGFRGMLAGLGVAVGILCIFNEVTGLLKEPQ
jgi:hypothetical protein